MTSTKQNYARKCRIPIDQIGMVGEQCLNDQQAGRRPSCLPLCCADLDFQVMDRPGDCQQPPTDGVYCQGLFLEGCKWDAAGHSLAESDPKVSVRACQAAICIIQPTVARNCCPCRCCSRPCPSSG